ncbi:MAG: iron-sulfur cluster assembly scaffold protein [Candidatus Micrarchaeota archaeon]|nr:iron-sulfur cluster assembly scaffold protein [Candidatus Micrarchaeota archaeon]
MDELYRAQILEHSKHPHHWGRLVKPSAIHTESNPTCGDELSVELLVQKGIVKEVGLSGAGCAISIASASMLADELEGKTVAQAAKIPRERVLELLGIDPGPSRLKCALLSWHALQKTLAKIKSD